ncbi:tRNA (adenosine(37)-N6)-threonylcarbamoyltransferase complex ATPase subunit type 1 TsaE [Tistrella bauzanensis]|uniref:tRNA (adenosine(37)-N6)-threonylcarbamoyltransferase complex ATPase subunit type 1 TsaE n=1 Tax=Tistrella TaxID=171436 RepID=UPI0031F6EFDB
MRLAREAETMAFARRLAPVLRDGGMVLLDGDLGAGKTAFARALIRSLAGADIEVPSPTFTLVQSYALDGVEVTHADLYRIDDPDEIDELGLEDAAAGGLVLVEWPERAGGRLDRGALRLRFAIADDGARLVTIDAPADWTARLGRHTCELPVDDAGGAEAPDAPGTPAPLRNDR